MTGHEAHLRLYLCGMDFYEENVQQESYRVMRALRLAQDNLKMDDTTIRDVGDRNDIVMGIARAVKEGLVTAPDILANGRILSPTEAWNDFFDEMYVKGDSRDTYRKAVRRQHQTGANWIEIMGIGAIMNPGAVPGSPIIFKEELQAACKTADYIGLSVAFHCHGFEEIKMCIRYGRAFYFYGFCMHTDIPRNRTLFPNSYSAFVAELCRAYGRKAEALRGEIKRNER